MAAHFPFACTNPLHTVVRAVSGALGEDDGVEVDGEVLRIRFGYAFSATVPVASVTATPYDGVVLSRGVHGWRGDWLVNTTGSDLVELRLDPPQRAKVLGVPVRLTRLRLSLADPEAFLAVLS